VRRHYFVALAAAALVGAVLALGASVVFTAPDTALPWSVSGGGGGGASSTNYALGATAGQPAIGQADSAGFQLGAGFWYGIDKDGDAIPDPVDNCPDAANAGQENFDADAMGDVCDPDDDNDLDPDVTDPDDDNDLYSDAVEAACGSITPNLSTPERLGNGINDDGDGSTDELQAPSGTTTADDSDCDGDGYDDRDEALYAYPASFGVGPEAGAACLNNSDDDGDGKRNDGCEPTGIDVRSGTDWQQRCGSAGAFNEADDQWPADFNDNGVVNITDVSSFAIPVPAVWSGGLPTLPGAPNYNARWDLSAPGGAINVLDISAMNRPIPSLGGITAGSVGLVLPCAAD